MSNAMNDNREWHYFVTTITDWTAGKTLLEAVNRLPKPSIDFPYLAIWRVPGPKDAGYSIEMYAPNVEGAELIYVDNGEDTNGGVYEAAAVRTKRGPHWVTIRPGAAAGS